MTRNKRKTSGKFWDKEYKKGTHHQFLRSKSCGGSHLAISTNPSEDLMKFTRWLERKSGNEFLNQMSSALDLGCGNGRNIIYLADTFGIKGTGYDISTEAISQAKKNSSGMPIVYMSRSIEEPIPLADESQNFVLDMMTSHFLNGDQRRKLRDEIYRVLRPGGWLFVKTFLLDEDKNARRLLRDNPGDEKGSYIHPEIGVSEHVFTEEEIESEISEKFVVHKILKSHGHLRKSGAKRRSISIYAQKI